jgi:hypothetical protein
MLIVFPPIIPDSCDEEAQLTSYQIEHPMRMLVLPAPLFAGSEPAAEGESIHDSDSVGKDLTVLSVSFLDVCVALYFITSLLHTRLQELAMSADAARRAPPDASSPLNTMMPLRELVNRYRSLAGEFGRPLPLAAFQLDVSETERLFSGYDEDYHISRFFHFAEGEGSRFSINGIPATHVSLDAEIESIL